MILVVLIIFISSICAINAQEIDENQTDNHELEISSADNNTQEVLSASDSAKQDMAKSSNQNPTGAYLEIDNDADKENIYIGDYVTWNLEARNYGPDVAKNVKLHNKLPKGLKYIKHTTTKGTFNPKTGIWDIGDLTIEEGIVSLFITAKAMSTGEKVNEAYITSDTNNTNDETFEEEEIDVFARDHSQESHFEKHVSAKMHETGNPIFLILTCLFALMIPVIKRR